MMIYYLLINQEALTEKKIKDLPLDKQHEGALLPSKHLHMAGHAYPGCWKQLDDFRQHKGKQLPDWPSWCFAPMAACYAIASGGGNNRLDSTSTGDVAQLAALGAWRYTQGIYQFDSAVYNAIATTMVKVQIPVEVLYRLPEWCVYVETPDLGLNYGFWAHLEHDINTGRAELRILLNTEGQLKPLILHLGDWTVTEAVDRMVSESFSQGGINRSSYDGEELSAAITELAGTAQHYIALLLYLCCDEPDFQPVENELPHRPKPKKTKKGWKLFPPKKPKVWHVGQQLACKLTLPKRLNENDRNSPAPHIRRAHWHGFWTGKKESSDRKFIYKWLPPLAVNVGDK
jgi:hypothetical protein